MSKRIRWFGLAMIVLFGALLLQLDNIQGLKASQYQKAGRNPVVLENEFSKPRGRIVSSDGVVLADSAQAPPNATYAFERQYPTGSLFAQIVGFTSYNYGTYTGVEAQYNNLLTYHTQPITNLGELFNTEEGTDQVILTVSDKLQTLARQALGSNDGAVVALNPTNGDILAMYSNPSFDPNLLASPSADAEAAGWKAYKALDAHGNTNGVPLTYDAAFPPGSTFKVVTTAAAFDHDKALTTMSYPYLSGYTPPGTNRVLHNDDGGSCGGTIEVMLPQSCDTGYAMMGVDLGAQNLSTEANSFGFGALPPIDLPTAPGSVSSFPSALQLEEAGVPYVAYSAIGQYNVRATPLEMALVASGIADDGVIMTPHVMARVLDPKDNVVESYNPTRWITATSSQTAQSITSLMEGVVTSGTAKGIFPASWDVAAKTGTAQDGTGNTSTDDWMIAFAPASHPIVAIAVLVPHQTLSATGASVAGPIVRTVLGGIFGGAS
jgi:penicillin-binding protein A